jgi:hydrogenase maturation factor
VLLLAGAIPVEAASIIARERRADLLANGWEAAEIDEAANLLHRPGISVLAPAQAAIATGRVTAMHDPTEGGVATGIQEIATAAHVDIAVNLDAIPVLPLAQRLCSAYGLDPLGAIASGSLLATCSAADAATLLEAWQQIGWEGAIIGMITAPAGSTPVVTAKRQGACVPFPRFSADEITRLWT